MCDENSPPTKNITTLFTYSTKYNADSVEWCPHDPFQDYFVCANYQLEEGNEGGRKRVGCILLFSVGACLHLHQTIQCAAVLDQKWCHNQIGLRSVLGVVNAQNTLQIYALNSHLCELELIASHTIQDDNGETLLLSLDWSTGKYHSTQPEIVCSDSKGDVHRFQFDDNKLRKVETYHGHEFEAWIAAFYCWDPNIFFSGGDDSCFCKFDKRQGVSPVARNRTHEAGVTAMHSNSKREYILATGSYDTNVRIWDMRQIKNPIDFVKMPGPLWRLKWDPFHHNFLLAACMQGGVHIIDSRDYKIIDSCYVHKNIAYGADWSFANNPTGDILIASCSFYDNLLCISKTRLNE